MGFQSRVTSFHYRSLGPSSSSMDVFDSLDIPVGLVTELFRLKLRVHYGTVLECASVNAAKLHGLQFNYTCPTADSL
jgi:hypothetical protein